MEKKLIIDKLMENLKKEIKKVFPRYPYLKRFFLKGNWGIFFSIKRKNIRNFTKANTKLFSKSFFGNYVIPSKVLLKIFEKLQSSKQIVVFSLGLGKQITFDKDMKDIFGTKIFLAGFEPSKDCYSYCDEAKVFDFLSNAAILDEKTYSLYSKKELSLQGAHVVESNSFKKQFKSKRDEKKIKTLTPYLSLKETGLNRVDFLKIDIENNTIPVIKDFIKLDNPPYIIVGEIEPYSFNKRKLSYSDFIESLKLFFNELKEKNYNFISTIDERKDVKYLAIEFIAVNEKLLEV